MSASVSTKEKPKRAGRVKTELIAKMLAALNAATRKSTVSERAGAMSPRMITETYPQ